jgi:hypothetical protein
MCVGCDGPLYLLQWLWIFPTSVATVMQADTVPPYLPLAFTTSLFVVLLLERVLHSLVWLCVSMVSSPILADRATVASEARGVMSGFVFMLFDLARILISAVSGIVQLSFSYVPILLIFFFFVWVMSLVVSTQSGVTRDLLFMWNNGGSTILRGTFVVPLQLANMVFHVMVPFWNAFVYFFKGMTNAVLMPALQENLDVVLKAVTAASGVIQGISASIVTFAASFQTCTDTACLSMGTRVFDVLTPMVHFRLLVSHALIFGRNTCSIVTPVLDMMAYPLLDTNFAQMLHAGINSPLYAVVQLPLVTYARCRQAADDKDERMRSLACTPDVAPVFNFAAASVRYGGILVDNWLDVTWVTILSVFGKAPEKCAAAPLHLKTIAEQTLFGGNETRIIGLGSSSYAITDGNSVQYTFYRGATEQVITFTQKTFPNNHYTLPQGNQLLRRTWTHNYPHPQMNPDNQQQMQTLSQYS